MTCIIRFRFRSERAARSLQCGPSGVTVLGFKKLLQQRLGLGWPTLNALRVEEATGARAYADDRDWLPANADLVLRRNHPCSWRHPKYLVKALPRPWVR